MSMRIAIITGASSGLGKEFSLQLAENFPDVECVWLVARRKALLDELAGQLSLPAVCVPLDLTDEADLGSLSRKLKDEAPDVRVLVNCAGCGYLGNVAESDPKLLARMTDLNIRALTLVTNTVLPYMRGEGRIINVSSIASFCPNARMTVYSSTKAYVSSFSLGLREELRERNISVTAVCSGPMDTEFLDIGEIRGNSKMFKTLPYCDPKKVAAGSYAAAKADRAFYTPRAFFKLYRFLAKILPSTIVVKLAKT